MKKNADRGYEKTKPKQTQSNPILSAIALAKADSKGIPYCSAERCSGQALRPCSGQASNKERRSKKGKMITCRAKNKV